MSIPGGGQALCLPHGGRVLGLFPPEGGESFFWNHSALGSSESAAAFFTSDEWHNSGGDRTWLAPEAELFIRDLTQPWETYEVPAAMDPADYTLITDSDSISLSTQMRVRFYHSRADAKIQLNKIVAPVANPVQSSFRQFEAIQYAGYSIRITLQVAEAITERDLCLGIWSLLQLPHGGSLIVQTKCYAEPSVMFDAIDPEDIEIKESSLIYRLRARGTQKIGLFASSVTGRVGYICKRYMDKYDLVIRDFTPHPNELYADVPWDNLTGEGYCFQACSVHSKVGQFSEMEHHSPGIVVSPSTPGGSMTDLSRVWAFRGSRKLISSLAEMLMNRQDSIGAT